MLADFCRLISLSPAIRNVSRVTFAPITHVAMLRALEATDAPSREALQGFPRIVAIGNQAYIIKATKLALSSAA